MQLFTKLSNLLKFQEGFEINNFLLKTFYPLYLNFTIFHYSCFLNYSCLFTKYENINKITLVHYEFFSNIFNLPSFNLCLFYAFPQNKENKQNCKVKK